MPSTFSLSPPQYKTITLDRGPDGLGFSIVGGYGSPHGDLPIYVKTVFGKVRGVYLCHCLSLQNRQPLLLMVCTRVCVCLGRSCRGRAPEARRPDHGRQRADSGGGFPRRGRQHSEEDQRNRHAHRAVIDHPHLHTHYTHSLSSAHNSILFTSAHLFCKLAAAARRSSVKAPAH